MREKDWIRLWLGLILLVALFLTYCFIEESICIDKLIKAGYIQQQKVGESGYIWVKQ